MESLLVACDFDGTITERDTLHVIVEEFGADGVWAELEPRLASGEISVLQAMQIQFAEVRATLSEVLAAVHRHAPLRPGLDDLLDWCGDAGHDVVVLSAGFRCVIDAVLARAGHGDLPVVSNDAAFSREGCRLSWELAGGPCERCGRPCKRRAMLDRAAGRRIVFIGDGVSDHCASQDADVVFARASLARFMDDRGLAYTPFSDFTQIRRALAPARAA